MKLVLNIVKRVMAVALFALLLLIAFNEGKNQPNARERLVGELIACTQIITAFQNAGQVNPMMKCEAHDGKASLGFPGHAEAPRFNLDGSLFN